MSAAKPVAVDGIHSLNETLVNIDLDDLTVEALDERIELSLAVIFAVESESNLPPDECAQYSCTMNG